MSLLVLAVGGAPAAAVPTPRKPGPSAPADAPGRATFGIGPATPIDRRGYFSYQIGAGGSYSDRAAVVNYSSRALALGIYAADLTNGSDGNIVVGLPSHPAHDAGAWITIPKKMSVIRIPAAGPKGPGRVLIPFHISVPAGAEPGDHAASIVAVLSTLGKNPRGENVRLNQRVGTRMFIRVSGPLAPALTVTGLTAAYQKNWNPLGTGNALVEYTVRNIGNVRLAADQKIEVSGWIGGSTVVTGAKIALLFPGASQTFQVRLPDVLPSIWTSASVTVTPHLFQDQAAIPLDPTTSQTGFYSIPWVLLAIILVLVLLGIGMLVVRRRRRRRRMSHAAPSRGRRRATRGQLPRSHAAAGASRHATTRAVMLVGAAMVVAAAALVVAPTSYADSVPFTDSNAVGYIGLCDASGHQITQGSLSDKPFVVRFVSSSSAPSGYQVRNGAKTTLFAYQPIDGIDAADWSGQAMTGSSFFSDNVHPLGAGTVLDYSMGDFISVYPPKWDGLVQLRIFYGAPNRAPYLQPYPATVLKIDGNRWHTVTGGPVDCSRGKVEPTERLALPKSAFSSASASIARSKSAAAARSGASESGPASASDSRRPGGAAATARGNDPAQSGRDSASAGSLSSGSIDSSPSPAAAIRSDPNGSGNTWPIVLVIVGGVVLVGGVVTWSVRRRPAR